MKKVLFIIATVILSINTHAQTYPNFKITDKGEIVWQKVYDNGNTMNDVFSRLLESGKFDEVRFYDNNESIICSSTPDFLNYTKAGIKLNDTPLYLRTDIFSFRAVIQFKDNKYRVSVFDMVFTETVTGGLHKAGTKNPIEFYALDKDGTILTAFNNSPTSFIIEYWLDKIFQCEKKPYLQTQW